MLGLSQAFGARIPAELSERSRHIGHAASKWVSEQHIPVGGVVTADGQAPFEPDRKLLWHWLVREELRGRYGDGADGLPVQRALASVMGRAIEGRIPATVWEGDAEQKWDPAANTIDGVANEGEDLARYEHWLAQFRVQQELDPYHPKHPTVLGRRFDLQREIPETEAVALIETLLDLQARNDLLDVVEAKLGRPLEAHDVYFEELGDDRPSRELDAIVAARSPTRMRSMPRCQKSCVDLALVRTRPSSWAPASMWKLPAARAMRFGRRCRNSTVGSAQIACRTPWAGMALTLGCTNSGTASSK